MRGIATCSYRVLKPNNLELRTGPHGLRTLVCHHVVALEVQLGGLVNLTCRYALLFTLNGPQKVAGALTDSGMEAAVSLGEEVSLLVELKFLGAAVLLQEAGMMEMEGVVRAVVVGVVTAAVVGVATEVVRAVVDWGAVAGTVHPSKPQFRRSRTEHSGCSRAMSKCFLQKKNSGLKRLRLRRARRSAVGKW